MKSRASSHPSKRPIVRLDELIKKTEMQSADAIPDGFFTASEYVDAWQRQKTTVLLHLRAGVAAGTVECREFRIRVGRVFRPVPHYKVLS